MPNNDGIKDSWNTTGRSDKIKKESTRNVFNKYDKELFSFNRY